MCAAPGSIEVISSGPSLATHSPVVVKLSEDPPALLFVHAAVRHRRLEHRHRPLRINTMHTAEKDGGYPNFVVGRELFVSDPAKGVGK